MAEKEYIEREAAYELARTSGYYSDFHRSMADLTSLKELLEDTPAADVVEVVRCKDCKFWGSSHNRCSVMSREIAQDGFVQTSGDFFCALAERKDKS